MEMGDIDGGSDSEKEFDQSELEVALYSQIHFDSGTNTESSSGNTSYHRPPLPFRIGVKELPTRITTYLKKPVFGGEFIAFSNCCEKNDESNSKLHHSTLHQQIDEVGVIKSAVAQLRKEQLKNEIIINLEDKATNSSNRLKSASFLRNETHHSGSSDTKPSFDNLHKFTITSAATDHDKKGKERDFTSIRNDFIDVSKVQYDGSKTKTSARKEEKTLAQQVKNNVKIDVKLKKNEVLLPFSVTKKPLKPKVTEVIDICVDKSVKITPCEPVEKKKANTKRVNSNLAKLEGFLKLSSDTDSSTIKLKKRSSINKLDAAVKPRKPAVVLRRPPVVAVKYRQDSDTNTDYSDSDASPSTSPEKGKKLNERKCQQQLKDSSQNSPLYRTDVKPKSVIVNSTNTVTAGRSGNRIISDQKGRSHSTVVKVEEIDTSSCSSEDNMNSEDESDTVEDEECDVQGKVKDQKSNVCEEAEDTSSHEELTTDSENTESSDPEDFMTDTIQGLEFNLDKGVDASTAAKPDADNWKIDDKDRHNVIGTVYRYFVPKVIQCRNCKIEGHLSRDCPKPLKRRCIFCGLEGHSYQACPNAVCFNCNVPGHRLSDCKERKQNWNITCGRCWMPGHQEEKCPDRWRQYHITVNAKGSQMMTTAKDAKNPLVFCYNCGQKGHLGFECKLPRMNQFTVASYPFIAVYDTKNKRKEMMRCMSAAESSRTAVCGRDDRHQSLDERKKRRRMQKDRTGAEVTCVNKKKLFRQECQDEQNQSIRKRGKKNKQLRKNNHKTNLMGPGGRKERNIPSSLVINETVFGRDLRENHAGHKRKFEREESALDDIWNDFSTHQVNNNEWWGRNETPATKRRKLNASPANIMGNNWQSDRCRQREGLSVEANTYFQRGQVNRMKSIDKSDWINNKHQQRVQDRHEHRIFTPEFSNYTNNHGQKLYGSNNSKHPQLQHAEKWSANQKVYSNSTPNKNGFRARNDRFVAMKRNCDITVNFRK